MNAELVPYVMVLCGIVFNSSNFIVMTKIPLWLMFNDFLSSNFLITGFPICFN